MSIIAFFFRFTLAYTALMALLNLTFYFLNITMVNAWGTPLLLGVAYWCFYSYSMNNNRVTIKSEKWELIFSALAGDTIAGVLMAIPYLLIHDEFPIRYMAVEILVLIPLHLVLFMIMEFAIRKQLLRQHPKFGRK